MSPCPLVSRPKRRVKPIRVILASAKIYIRDGYAYERGSTARIPQEMYCTV